MSVDNSIGELVSITHTTLPTRLPRGMPIGSVWWSREGPAATSTERVSDVLDSVMDVVLTALMQEVG